MSRLVIPTNSEAQNVVEGLYKDLERRIIASPPGLCPVDLTAAFLKMCHAQTCGKCVPCRIGLAQLSNLLEDILNGKGTMKHLTMLEETARVIESTADCAIGYTAAQMVLKGLDGSKRILWNISYTTAAAVILISRFPVWLCARPELIFRVTSP